MFVDIFGILGKKEVHKFVPLREIEEEFRPKSLLDEDVQRPIRETRVRSIYESLKEGKTCQGVFTFVIATLAGERILVDGQHRLGALRMFVDEEKDLEAKDMILDETQIHVREIEVRDKDQAIRLRNELGDVIPVDPLMNSIEVRCGNIFEHFLSGCVNKPVSSESPRYGNWSKYITRTIRETGFYRHFESPETMIQEVRQLNEYLFENCVKKINRKVLDLVTGCDKKKQEGILFKQFRVSHHQRNHSSVMCLHLVVRYGFMELILDKIREKSPDYETYFKRALSNSKKFNFNSTPSPKEKTDCLDRFFGSPQVGEQQIKPCPVCSNVLLNREDSSSYHFGHIVARARGGANLGSNLLPVCPKCNLDCGSKNMKEYCLEKFGKEFLL
jgi:hypothetical protein